FRTAGRRVRPERLPDDAEALRLDPAAPRPRTLTPESLAGGARDAARTRVPGLPPSTLVHPRY
ncbi:spermidine synthase, partial [Streptomyces olivaceus]